MKQERRVHKIYTEWEELKKKGYKLREMFGKWQHIFSSPKGEISCVELKEYSMDRETIWEIYCLKGELFKDTERFSTFERAKARCQELLG